MEKAQVHQLDQHRASLAARKISDLDHWLEISKRVDDPAMAEIIVGYLDQYPAVKARFGGLYIRAQDTLARRRQALAAEVAEQLAAEYAARQAIFNKGLAGAARFGNFVFRSVRLMFRAGRDLVKFIQERSRCHRPLQFKVVPINGRRS